MLTIFGHHHVPRSGTFSPFPKVSAGFCFEAVPQSLKDTFSPFPKVSAGFCFEAVPQSLKDVVTRRASELRHSNLLACAA
jgi:hypothetical protein